VSLSPSEIMVTRKTIDDIAQSVPAALSRIVLLANRVHFLTAAETIGRILSRLQAPVLPVSIPYFKAYQHLSTVTPALSPVSMAANNYKKAVTELLRLLGGNDLFLKTQSPALEDEMRGAL